MRAWGGLAIALVLVATVGVPNALGDKKATQCVGPLGPVTVVGDLEVPNGADCQLAGTKVTGDVVVDAAATLETSANASIGEDLTCGGTSCTLDLTTVSNDAILPPGQGTLSLYGTHIQELKCSGLVCQLGFDVETQSIPAVIDHKLSANNNAYVLTEGIKVGQNVECNACNSIDLFDSTVNGDVHSTAQTAGGFICNNTIHGNVEYAQSPRFVLTCGGNTIGGNLSFNHNNGALAIVNNTVGKNLQVDHNVGETDVIGNVVGDTIHCEVDKNSGPIVGAGNTAKHIDRQCGPIGTQTGS